MLFKSCHRRILRDTWLGQDSNGLSPVGELFVQPVRWVRVPSDVREMVQKENQHLKHCSLLGLIGFYSNSAAGCVHSAVMLSRVYVDAPELAWP
jgi:hypothetical protein